MWWPHLVHLLGRSWTQVLAWRSATTFSLLLEVAIPCFIFLLLRLWTVGSWKQMFTIRGAWPEVRSLLTTLVVLLAIAGTIFIAAIPVVIDQDHNDLVTANKKLREQYSSARNI